MGINPRKRKIADDEDDVQALTASKRFLSKKANLRTLLQTPNDEIQGVLEDFLLLLKHSKYGTSTAREFFADGGSCMEIFQQLEHVKVTSCAVRFEVAALLISYVAGGGDDGGLLQRTCEACEYLVHGHHDLLQRLCSDNSVSNAERRAVLELFGGMVTLRSRLAGDVLKRIKFNTLLYRRQHLAFAGDVRAAFIRFIVAVLDAGDVNNITLLLHQAHLLAAVITDLRYDTHDIVVSVLHTLRTSLTSISKSLKMKAFPTMTLRHLVQLYDWKGPTGYDQRRRRAITANVDLEQRETVAHVVHDCLLTWCTSSTHGVLFNDPQMGVGREHRNPLLYSMLDGITSEQLLDNDLLRDLVLRICGAAPDLVRAMWTKLAADVQPRDASNWHALMSFGRRLLGAVAPGAVIRRATSLTALQYAQVVQTLIAPTNLLQVLLAGDELHTYSTNVRSEIVRTLCCVVEAVREHLHAGEAALGPIHQRVLRTLLVEQVERHLPPGDLLARHWLDDMEVLRLLQAYADVAPDMLLNLHLDNVTDVWQMNLSDEFRVRFTSFLVTHDARQLAVDGEIFVQVICNLAQMMRQSCLIDEARKTFEEVLVVSGLFDLEERNEMRLWIDAATFKHMPTFFSECLQQAHANAATLQRELRTFFHVEDLEENDEQRITNLLQHLQNEVVAERKFDGRRMRFSIVTLQCVKQLPTASSSKLVKRVAALLVDLFHLQSDIRPLQALTAAYRHHLPPTIVEHILQYTSYVDDATASPAARIASAICWLTQGAPAESDFDLLLTVVKDALGEQPTHNHLVLIYGNVKLLEAFMQPPDSALTRFVLDITLHLQQKHDLDLDVVFREYRRKLHGIIMSPHLINVEMIVSLIHADDGLEMLRQVGEHAKIDDFLSSKSPPRTNLRYKLLVAILEQLSTAEDALVTGDNLHHRVVSIVSELNALDVDTGELAMAMTSTWTRLFADVDAAVNQRLCASIFRRAEFCKRNAQLLMAALSNVDDIIMHLLEQPNDDAIAIMCSKPGHALPILDLVYASANITSIENEKCFLQHLLPLIGRVLEKPHKAGAHIATHFSGLCALIERCMTLEEVRALGVLDKMRKFKHADAFLAAILSAIGRRCVTLSSDVSVAPLVMTIMTIIVGMTEAAVITACDHFTRLLAMLQVQIDANLDVCKRFHRFCLQFGVSQEENASAVLVTLSHMPQVCIYDEDELSELLSLLLTHPRFEHVILEAPCIPKQRIFDLVETWLRRHPSIMRKEHIVHLLAAYTATRHPCDIVIRRLLEMYAQRTDFDAFRPLMWGPQAYQFYAGDAWRRETRAADVLRLIDVDLVVDTISSGNVNHVHVYDVDFVMSVLSQLLAEERRVKTALVMRCGVIALVALALGDANQATRMAGCHVLARLFYHLQATASTSELWMRYVEALTRGAGDVRERPLNGFASVFMARTALVLRDPHHEMYAALGNYISVKQTPDLSGVPEVNALLQSSAMTHHAHRAFILDVIADGLRCERDFDVAAVGGKLFKRILCLHDARVCDLETRHRVLRVLLAASRLPNAARQLCDKFAIFGWLNWHEMQQTHEDREIRGLMAEVVRNLCAVVDDDADKTMFQRLHDKLAARCE